MKMLISIIVPVYNVENQVATCIKSILSQTYTNFELILIDDGSTDASGLICDEFAQKDSRIKVIHLSNGGAARARNVGIKEAKGEFIGFVDADDRIDNRMYKCLFENIENYSAEVSFCNYYRTDENDVIIEKLSHGFPDKTIIEGNKIITDLISRYYGGNICGIYSLCNKLYRKSILAEKHIVIDESKVRGEDAWFNLIFFQSVKRIVASSEHLYYYRSVNSNSIMRTIRESQYLESKQYYLDLLKLNDEKFKLKIDKTDFYKNMIINTTYYMFQVLASEIKEKKNIINPIVTDPDYRAILKYDKKCPLYIKVINKAIVSRNSVVLKVLLSIGTLIFKLKIEKK